MASLLWIRSKDENDSTIYDGVQRGNGRAAFRVTSYGKGGFEVRSRTDDKRWWAESLAEAKLMAEFLFVGGDPAKHRTYTSYSRHSVPPRGSWTNIWKWRCQCGAKSSGGYDGKSVVESAREHRMAAMQAHVDTVEGAGDDTFEETSS